jgi:cysteine-rich repeat protein
MLGPVVLNGTGSPTQSGGGCGGFIDIEARFGNASINFPISAESGAPDGGGGGISVVARGSITQTATAHMSVQGQGPQSCGGEISLEADIDVTAHGNMNASGGFGGNLIDLIAGRHVILNGMAEAQGRDAGGFGGSATFIGGDRGLGDVAINNLVDVGGGGCGTLNGCGLGGFTEVTGCNATVAAAASLLARAADGGDNLVVAREKLTIQGIVDASGMGGTPGTNTLQHPTRVAPTIVAANVTPAPTTQSLATCTTAGQTACLIPCPACGNGMVEFPETCDQSGNTAHCDGCSSTCQTQNCIDTNLCTTDSCDATLGCRNLPVPDDTSCTDNNVCNGVEVCRTGSCRPGTPLNCVDTNQCTTDSCNTTLGCQNPPSSTVTPCNDGNACTAGDLCNGMGACAPGQNVCNTTTTSVPTTTSTSRTSTSSTSTSTSSTSTSSTTSTSTAVPTTTSTSATVPTTTSTSRTSTSSSSTSTSSTTSTSAAVPSTTSTSVRPTTTTSTSTSTPSTTSTTLASTCVPADCNDGNACSTDTCVSGTCVHSSEGFDAVNCELAKLLEPSCAPDPIDARLMKTFRLKTTTARNLVGKAENNTKAETRLVGRALKQLNALRNRVGRSKKITESCRATLDALIAERIALVQGLSI